MAEKETIYSSKIKYDGFYSFRSFYKFCYDWLIEEMGLDLKEKGYEEKIKGDEKDVVVEWEGERKLTDYFKIEVKIKIKAKKLRDVEIVKEGVKIGTNKGGAEVEMKGTLVRDYKGKFEMTAFKKVLRGIYEKWVIASRIEEYEDKIASKCNDFLEQSKDYLDLEGKQ